MNILQARCKFPSIKAKNNSQTAKLVYLMLLLLPQWYLNNRESLQDISSSCGNKFSFKAKVSTKIIPGITRVKFKIVQIVTSIDFAFVIARYKQR